MPQPYFQYKKTNNEIFVLLFTGSNKGMKHKNITLEKNFLWMPKAAQNNVISSNLKLVIAFKTAYSRCFS